MRGEDPIREIISICKKKLPSKCVIGHIMSGTVQQLRNPVVAPTGMGKDYGMIMSQLTLILRGLTLILRGG